ncbi:MAG: GSCFA domain-containing protein [Saprospiraceae bacterium]
MIGRLVIGYSAVFVINSGVTNHQSPITNHQLMQLQTIVPIPSPNFSISHTDKILTIGSCFAQNMSKYLTERKFQVTANPFGILYNPLSIAQNLTAIIENKTYQETDLFYHNERWNSFDHHSDFSFFDKKSTLKNINENIEKAHQQLLDGNVLMITLGTAFTYFNNKKPVANCHKLPAKDFKKRLVSVAEIVQNLSEVIQIILTKNPNLQIVFTLSPIRHIRDGVIENQRSKATLLLALHQLKAQFEAVYYFPSYEIVLDELRDYRFYGTDLVHLNETGLGYIWERFSGTFFEKITLERINQFQKITKAFHHRPFHPTSEQHLRFLKKYTQITAQYQKQFPFLDFEKEIAYFKS